MNDTICRDCDKLGSCTMKCAALRASEISAICPDEPETITTPPRTLGAVIALNICGRGQVLRGIVRIKQTEEKLIFIDSEGRENHIAKKLIDVMEVIA